MLMMIVATDPDLQLTEPEAALSDIMFYFFTQISLGFKWNEHQILFHLQTKVFSLSEYFFLHHNMGVSRTIRHEKSTANWKLSLIINYCDFRGGKNSFSSASPVKFLFLNEKYSGRWINQFSTLVLIISIFYFTIRK